MDYFKHDSGGQKSVAQQHGELREAVAKISARDMTDAEHRAYTTLIEQGGSITFEQRDMLQKLVARVNGTEPPKHTDFAKLAARIGGI